MNGYVLGTDKPVILSGVNRLEVIKVGKGREYMLWGDDVILEACIQDEGRTLKVFVSQPPPEPLAFTQLNSFVGRLKRCGVDVELSVNAPWVYLDRVNGIRVIERRNGDTGYTIGYLPIKKDQQGMNFLDLTPTFELIRDYIKRTI